MQPMPYSSYWPPTHSLFTGVWMAVFAGAASAVSSAPYVEFDFARAAACVDVTPTSPANQYAKIRFVKLNLPVSVRFHGLTMDEVDEIDIEISGAAAGLRVYDFAPTTQLASDVAQQIETTTTTKRARSLDGTLGGSLPVPYAELVAHVSPSINAGISGSEVETERMNRLPPMHAVVVSGTSSEGRGVFFKLKRSSQTTLEGVHGLSVTFAAPPSWRGGDVQVSCTARGRRKLLWITHAATLGEESSSVRLHPAGTVPAYHVAKPVVVTPIAIEPYKQMDRTAEITKKERDITKRSEHNSDRDTAESVIENGATAGL
jgi:hypothetical protein